MNPSQTIAVTTRHGRLSVPTERAQGVSCKKRIKKLTLYSEKLFKNSLLQRPSGKLSLSIEHGQTGFKLTEHAQKVLGQYLDACPLEEED